MLPPMEVVIALGGNQGDRASFLTRARDAIEADAALDVIASSPLYETAPVGPPQPHYLNAALLVRTTLTPDAVLARCLAIERTLGRIRDVRWGPRTIDLDLLWADEGDGVPRVVSSDSLSQPHPHLGERAFALAPLLDVRPDLEARFGPTLDRLGGRPPTTAVKGWTSFLRRK